MKNLFLFFCFLPLVISSLLPAQQEQERSSLALYPPDPMVLQKDWTQYLNVPEQDLLQRIEIWENSLKETMTQIEWDDPSEVENRMLQMSSSLRTYQQLRLQGPVLPPRPQPFLAQYTADQVIELHRSVQIAENELKGNEQTLANKKNVLDALQKQQVDLQNQFQNLPERSQEKFIFGLRVINTQLKILITREEIERLQKNIQVGRESVRHAMEELQYSLQHLELSPGEVVSLRQKQNSLEEAWRNKQREREKVEIEAMHALSDNGTAAGLTRDEWWQQQILQASVNESLAFSELLLNQLKIALIQLRSGVSDEDLSQIRVDVQRRHQQLAMLDQQTTEWLRAAEKGQKRAGQVLSLLEKDGLDDSSRQLIVLEKEIVDSSQRTILDLQKLQGQNADAKFLLQQIDQEFVYYFGRGKKWFQDVLILFTGLFRKFQSMLNYPILTLGENSITFLGIFYAALILSAAIWLSKILSRIIGGMALGQQALQRSIVYRLSRLAKYFVIGLGFLLALMALGFDLTTFLFIAGALGVGIGFGLQEIFRNFISGIIILFESHLRVGDFIELEQAKVSEKSRGVIREINFRNTVLTTNDGVDILVPNSEMINTRVVNWTLKDPYRRVHIPFTVAYGTDKDLVRKLVQEAAMRVSSTLQQSKFSDPVVYLTNLGDNGLEMQLVVWVHEKAATRLAFLISDYLWEIEKVLRENQIEIPFPKRDVHILKKAEHET